MLHIFEYIKHKAHLEPTPGHLRIYKEILNKRVCARVACRVLVSILQCSIYMQHIPLLQ